MKVPHNFFIIFVWASIVFAACSNRKQNSTEFNNNNTKEYEEQNLLKDTLSDMTIELSYKELVLGDSFSECIKRVEKNQSMRSEWDSDNKRTEYISELLNNEVHVTLEQFQDTIYEIKLNSSKFNHDKLDSLYISKYGKPQYKNIRQNHCILGWGTQNDTRWEFKNGNITIQHFNDNKKPVGAIVIYRDKRHYRKMKDEEEFKRKEAEKAREVELKAEENARKKREDAYISDI